MIDPKLVGRSAFGIKTPIIQTGDNLIDIVIRSVVAFNEGKFRNGDIIAVTEAVVAIAQGNYASNNDIQKDVERKFAGSKVLAIVDPIQSRNRFVGILEAIANTPCLEKIVIAMTYPSDEVGNGLISNLQLIESGVNASADLLNFEEFEKHFGKPCHVFTKQNYPQMYIDVCKAAGKEVEVVFVNDFSKLREHCGCNDYLVCSIHRSEETKAIIKRAGGNPRILTLADIMNESIEGSGYNAQYGLYGTNKRDGGSLKLMPKDCQEFVEEIQRRILESYGVKIEVMVYGDGAFKDPVGHIWELADPTTTLAATDGLFGTPKEVKLKYIASSHEDKTPEEVAEIVAQMAAERRASNDLASNASLGTTPRQITDLVASLCDLVSGSGDKCTPVVYITGY